MKVTGRVFATSMAAGAGAAGFVWFAWDLPWQALGLGLLVGLVVYANMSPSNSSENEIEIPDIHDVHPPS